MKLEKDRRGSTGELAKFMKRKREGEGGESEERKMEEVFRSSKKTLKSPVKMGEEREMKEILKELKEMRVEMRECLKGMSKEIKEVAEGQKEWMRKEMEKVKEELRVKEEKWQRERGEILERLKALEGKLGEIKVVTGERKGEGGKEREEGKVEKEEGKEIWMERIKRLERRSEWREREERKRNVVIKGIKGGEGEIERKVKEIWVSIKKGVVVEKIRMIEVGRRGDGWGW
ncbi:hypothetical protein ALC57_16267 [Trachymyrmex cornetzi]|uniref:Uncharacterized protein n=1 Tax=Trachymyrmex cornetzi TaxID=471704 RepID=A0A151IVH0_9HYME|nr:hypothetical protein ALC57_16267 [Trachymyrmex cornetzi]